MQHDNDNVLVPEGAEVPLNWTFLNAYEKERLVTIYHNKCELVRLGLETYDMRYLIGKPPAAGKDRKRPAMRDNKRSDVSFVSDRPRKSPRVAEHAEVSMPSLYTIVDDMPPAELKEAADIARRQKREEDFEAYETFWWKRPDRPHGMLRHPKSTKHSPLQLLWVDLPVSLLVLLEPKIQELKRDEMFEPLTQEQLYSYVSMQNSLVKGVRAFRGWQVQLSITGPNSHRIGVAWESKMGALMAVAALIDSRLQSTISATSWVMTLVEQGASAVNRWVSEVGGDTIQNTIMIKLCNRNGGRRPGESAGGLKAREEMLQSGYEHPASRSAPFPTDSTDSPMDDDLPLPMGFLTDHLPEEDQNEPMQELAETTDPKLLVSRLLNQGISVPLLFEQGFDIASLCSVLPMRKVIPYAPVNALESSGIPRFLYRKYLVF